jgi:predicted CXXCH cytochrome family protein
MRKLTVSIIVVVISTAILAISGIGVALGLENQDAFCASCHTEPESKYYGQSTQSNATTLAAYHAQKQTACIDCHSGGGTLGRAVGLRQGAHDLMLYLSGNYHRPAITTNPLGDDSCTKCHDRTLTTNHIGASRTSHYHTYLLQWQAVDPQAAKCATCHTAHVPNLASLMFMSQGKVSKLCDDCHTALSGQILK